MPHATAHVWSRSHEQEISSNLISLALAFSLAVGWEVNGWRADVCIAHAESAHSKQPVARGQQAGSY
ncbi:hypothetical protein APV28_3510 [Comamonas testosteroni]|nr:hypothetical protein APV28_3510 [Comamonas testosteroni]